MRLGLKRVCTGAKLAAAILLTEASSALQWDEEGGASHAFNSGRQGEATADVINSVHRVQSAHRADALAKAASVCAAAVAKKFPVQLITICCNTLCSPVPVLPKTAVAPVLCSYIAAILQY